MTGRRKNVLVVDALEETRERLATPLKRDYRIMRARVRRGRARADGAGRHRSARRRRRAARRHAASSCCRSSKRNYPFTESHPGPATSDVDGAVQAIKLGAYHFLSKTVDPDTLRTTVAHAPERQDLNRRVLTLHAEVQDPGEREFVAGPSTAMRDVLETVHKIGKLSATVLILGESGTGKELLARLHRDSANRRATRTAPFIAVNLAAIPRELVESTLFGHEKGSFTGALQQRIGKFELANGGTLFLDEIGDLKLDLQAKLLRAIQEGEIERVGGAKPIKTDVPADRGDQRRPREGGEGRHVPRRPLLPPQRHPGAAAAAARAHRGPAGARRVLPASATARASTRTSRASPSRRCAMLSAATGGRATSASSRT